MPRAYAVSAAALLSLLAAPAHAAAFKPCPQEAATTPAPCERVLPPCPQPEAPCQR